MGRQSQGIGTIRTYLVQQQLLLSLRYEIRNVECILGQGGDPGCFEVKGHVSLLGVLIGESSVCL